MPTIRSIKEKSPKFGASVKLVERKLQVLKTELKESGYKKGQKEFTPKQMELICERIGYPVKQ